MTRSIDRDRRSRRGQLTNRRRRDAAPLRIEALESRAVLSASVGLPPIVGAPTGIVPASQTAPQATVARFGVLAPPTAPNGAPVQIVITALDTRGLPVRSATGTVNLATSDTAATLPATATLREGRAVVTATFGSGGRQTITATDPADPAITGTAATNVAAPQVLTSYRVSLRPATIAGTATEVVILALDATGRPLRVSGPLTTGLTSTDEAAVLPNVITFREGRASFPVTFNTAGQQTLTVSGGPEGSITASATTTVSAAPVVTKFGLVLPGRVPNGVAVQASLVALDANGRVVPTYAGTANLASSDSAATLPASVTFVAGRAGFKVTFATAGAQTVTATDAANGSLTGTATTTVAAPQTLASFRVLLRSSAIAGAPAEATILALDAAGLPLRGFAGPVTLASSDVAAVLPETVTFRDGRAELRVTFNTLGQQSLTVRGGPEGGITATATTTVTVAPVVARFAMLLPSRVRAGATVSVAILAVDANGRPVQSFSGEATLTSSDPAAVLPAKVTFRDGRAVASVKFTTLGRQTLTATGGASGGITGSASTLVGEAVAPA